MLYYLHVEVEGRRKREGREGEGLLEVEGGGEEGREERGRGGSVAS